MTKNPVLREGIISGWFEKPLVASPELAKVMEVKLPKPGTVLELRVDNRFKDGNIKVVDNVVRGNKNSVILRPLQPTNTNTKNKEI